MTQTKLEQSFAKKVEHYCLEKQTTPWIICSSFGYTNMQAIVRFLTGEGTISSRTMGLIDEYMKKNK
jgi:hypothetical protein